MTRRERLERRQEKREDWAASRDAKATADFNRARGYTEGIPFGQPILVGHHSEKRHRRALENSDKAMRRASESSSMAEHHRSKADGLARQLERSTFSDDPDAIEQLTARVEAIDAQCERRKAINREIKKGDGWADRITPPLTPDERTELDNNARFARTIGYPPYSLANARSNARRLRQRIAEITARQKRAAEAEAAGVGIKRSPDGTYASITFPEKPPRDVLAALKDNGWHWGAGCWSGYLARLPESVVEYCVGEIRDRGNMDPEADDTGPSDDDLRRTFFGDVEADRRDDAASEAARLSSPVPEVTA